MLSARAMITLQVSASHASLMLMKQFHFDGGGTRFAFIEIRPHFRNEAHQSKWLDSRSAIRDFRAPYLYAIFPAPYIK